MAKKAKKLSIAKDELAEAEKHLSAFVAKEVDTLGDESRRAARRFRQKNNGPLRQRMTKRFYPRYLAEGGKPRDWEAFWKYLLENLPKLIAMLVSLFGGAASVLIAIALLLFGGAAA